MMERLDRNKDRLLSRDELRQGLNEMGLDIRNMRVDMHVDLCIDMCVDMHVDLCVDMCVDMRMDFILDKCTVNVHGPWA